MEQVKSAIQQTPSILSGKQMPEFKKLITKLKKHYGAPTMPPAKGPFELVMWENACYLLPDDRRVAVFNGLREQIGLNAKAILNADPDVLLTLATMGGMRPKVRIFRWQEIARITLSQFDDNQAIYPTCPTRKPKKR